MSLFKTFGSCFLFSVLMFGMNFGGVFADEDLPAPPGWPAAAKTIQYRSSADNTMQKAVFYSPNQEKPVPLIVGLHTWSADYKQPNTFFLTEAQSRGWAMICPNFRGTNTTSQACGSELVVQDVVSAVEYMKNRVKIDPDRIYLMGMSGGGYLSMLMAGRHPEIWAGVCSWVGISNLTDWYHETKKSKLNYYRHLEKVCGGAPGTSTAVDEQYKSRSAITWVEGARQVPLNLNHGIHDGHGQNSVPVSQSIHFFNRLVPEKDQLSKDQIQWMFEKESIPDELAKEKVNDPMYGKMQVLFRRTVGNVQLTLFEGGHQAVPAAGFDWLSKQKRGQKPHWSPSGLQQEVKEINVAK